MNTYLLTVRRAFGGITLFLLTLLVSSAPHRVSAGADDDTPRSVTRNLQCMRDRGWKVTASDKEYTCKHDDFTASVTISRWPRRIAHLRDHCYVFTVVAKVPAGKREETVALMRSVLSELPSGASYSLDENGNATMVSYLADGTLSLGDIESFFENKAFLLAKAMTQFQSRVRGLHD